jgi:glutamate-1-semialdehyde 2,1-aminomutase
VYQAGTLSGNPIAMIAGFTALSELNDNPSIFDELNKKTEYLHQGIEDVLKKTGKPYRINRCGSMISIHFTNEDIVDMASASRADIPLFNKMFHFLLDRGIYLPPSAYESWFLNNALTYADLDETINGIRDFCKEI